MGTFLSRVRPLETCAKHYQPPRRLRTQSVEEFIDSATPCSEFFLGTFKRARIRLHGGDFGRNFGASSRPRSPGIRTARGMGACARTPSVDSYLDLDPKGHRFGSRSKKRQNFKCRFLGQFASYACQISGMDTRQRPPSNCAIATTYLDPNEQGVGVKKWRVQNCRTIFVEPVVYSPYVKLS